MFRMKTTELCIARLAEDIYINPVVIGRYNKDGFTTTGSMDDFMSFHLCSFAMMGEEIVPKTLGLFTQCMDTV